MGEVAETSAKRGLLAGWDFGDTVRVVIAAVMVWQTIEAPATTTLPAPYSTISLVAYYCSLPLVLLTPQFWARFGRPHGAEAVVILPGDRLFQVVTCIGLVAMTPQTILWAVETPISEPWSFGFYWLCVALFALGAAVCLRNLLRANDLMRLDAHGIAAPRLWRSVIPWSTIKSARSVGTRSDTALFLTFDPPTEVELMKRPWLDWSVKLGTERRSLLIPGLLLGMPADRIAALLEKRRAEHEPGTEAAT